MATARVALIYDDRPRPETTGLYCLRALSTMAHVEHFRPDRLAEASRRNFELYLYVDDGLRYAVPDELHPSAWWAIDTHLDFEWCLAKASAFDVVFAAQRDGAERLREQGIATATWLPLACDPEIHRRHGVDKSVDVCFLGNLVGDERSRLVRLIEEHFPNVLVAQRYFDEMARTYSASRIVFNRSVAGDVNMRVFEALACGSLLVTDDLSENGQAELFRDGVHLATYGGPEELLEKIAFYLERDELREKIAEAGRREVLAKHTYRHRMEKLLAAARKYVSPRQVTAVVPASPPVVRDGSYFEFDRPELLAMVPESARRVLDVGCGTGRLGASIKARQKAEVVGIELDAEAARAATTRLDRVVVGDVEKLDGDLSRERFDCVICGDVLEHLREPDGLLRRASGWLGGDGALVASIPNARHYSVVQSLLSGNWTYERAGLLDRDHVRFFTRREIEKLLYRAGYWIDDLRLVPGAGFEEWRQRGRPGAVQVGRLHVGGMPAHEAEEFYVYQYLLRARPVPIPEQGLTSVVIVTHNQLAYTRLCVGSLLEHTDGPYELIFVDNASTDGTVDYLRALEGATVISNGENRGFPAAANQGIRAATGAQVLLLNNDTVVTTGWLRRLLDALYRDSRIGLVGPCSNCVSGPQQVQVGYDALEGVDGFAWDWGKAHDGRTEETDRLVGFCLLFRRELVERIGPLDERFGVGCFEDDDFTLRARRAGYRAVIARDAFVHHFGGRTFTGSGVDFAALMRENESLFREKWSGAEEVECGKEKCACSKPEGNDEPRKGRCRGGRCDWIARVKQSIARAQRHESRLTPEALALPGMSSDKVRHLLNNLCGCEDVSYLEIGLHAGSTFCAALCNNSIDAVGIENWSQFDPGDARRRFEAAYHRFAGANRVSLIYEDAFCVAPDRLDRPVNVFFYDGEHSYASQRRALEHFAAALDSRFVLLVDDYNLEDVKRGTQDALRGLGYRCVWQRELHADGNCDRENWWNGLYVAVVETEPVRGRLKTGPRSRDVPKEPRSRMEVSSTRGTSRYSAFRSDHKGLSLCRRRVDLSLCMIVRDNAGTIEPCLKSIRPWVDEMVVVDTGSKDETPWIAERLGARVFHFPWCDDFSAARNESIRHARGRWIFWMDSDDTIDAANGRKLRQTALNGAAPSVLGYVMQVHCPGPGEEGKDDVTVVDHVKLFRNLPELRFEGRIHEQVLPAVRRAGGEVGWTDVFVTHSGYDHSERGQQRKRERDFRLLELELRDRPDHPFGLFNLGMTQADVGEHEKAIESLRRSIAVSDPGDSHVRKAYALLVSSYAELNRLEEAWETCQEGRRLYPKDAELLFREGLLHHRLGRLEEAVEAYQAVLESDEERHFSSLDAGIRGFKTRQNLAVVYREMGELAKAEDEWRRVVEEMPSYHPGWRGLGEVLLRQGKLDDARVLAECLSADPALVTEGTVLRAETAAAQGNWPQAKRILDEAAGGSPHDLEVLQVRCRLLFEHGEPSEAEQALKALIARDPQDASAHHNLGTTYLRMGKHQAAVGAYRESLRRRPDHAETLEMLSHALRQDGARGETVEA